MCEDHISFPTDRVALLSERETALQFSVEVVGTIGIGSRRHCGSMWDRLRRRPTTSLAKIGPRSHAPGESGVVFSNHPNAHGVEYLSLGSSFHRRGGGGVAYILAQFIPLAKHASTCLCVKGMYLGMLSMEVLQGCYLQSALVLISIVIPVTWSGLPLL